MLVPASTVVLDAPALAALPVIHAAEVVSFLPGFHVAQPQFYAGRPVVSARGFFGGGEAEYILLLVDGQPAADVESGLIDWSLVPTSSVRRIEAFRGPGASMYGDSAIGGVIQILTDHDATGGQLTATGGSFESFTADSAYGRRTRSIGFNLSGARWDFILRAANCRRRRYRRRKRLSLAVPAARNAAATPARRQPRCDRPDAVRSAVLR